MNTLRKLISVRIYLLCFFEAILIAACYTAAVFVCRPIDAGSYLEYEAGGLRIAFVAVTFLISAYLFDFYRQSHITSRLLLILELCNLMGIVLLIQAALSFINPDLVLPQAI